MPVSVYLRQTRKSPFALFTQPAVFTTKTAKLLTLGARQPIVSATFVEVGLADPVADGLVRALELAGEFANRAPRANQLHHLAAKLRRIRQMCSWHRGFLLPKGFGIHESGSTPLVIAQAMGVLKIGTVSLDGTKVKANASKHKAT